MNQLEQFLQTLWVKGVRLWPQEGKLRYRGPESQLTPELLSQLQQQKAELIQHLSEATVGPLSYGQNGLWYIQQSAPDNAAYHLSLAFHIYSTLDCNLFQNAAQLLVNRHAALRTTFPVQEGIPVQKVHGYQPVAFQTVDAQGWSEETLLAHLKAEHERPFDLADGPLFRVTVFARAAEDFAVLINAHHIVIDGWSTYILLEELLVLYHALQHGIVAQLPLLKQSYTDYVSWQHDLIERKGDQL